MGCVCESIALGAFTARPSAGGGCNGLAAAQASHGRSLQTQLPLQTLLGRHLGLPSCYLLQHDGVCSGHKVSDARLWQGHPARPSVRTGIG